MPEDKKPKIDLKARLGKAATPPPAAVAPVAVPSQAAPISAPRAPGSVPTPMQSGPAPGVPVGPPAGYQAAAQLDAGSPFAPVAPYRPQQAAPAPMAPQQPQRIEVDEMAVQSAAKSARKQGVVIGLVFAVILGAVGYVGGGAAQQGADRTRSHNDAAELKTDVGKARDALKTMADKVEAGANNIKNDHKFPDTLSTELGAINVDFDGSKLAGRRFSGFPAATASDLVEFITAVQAINDRKLLIQGLLNTLKKPITEQFAVPAGQVTIGQVVVVSKDPSGNLAGFLAALQKPIVVTKDNISLPPKLTFTDPAGGGNAEAPRYNGGDPSKDHSALYVVPKTFETACPSAKAGQVSQLGAQMGNFIHDIRGDKPAGTEDIVQDSKPGLIERADKLMTELEKVSN